MKLKELSFYIIHIVSFFLIPDEFLNLVARYLTSLFYREILVVIMLQFCVKNIMVYNFISSI